MIPNDEVKALKIARELDNDTIDKLIDQAKADHLKLDHKERPLLPCTEGCAQLAKVRLYALMRAAGGE